MTEARNLTLLFCDDVRREEGNKYSLMGCYADELIVDKLPAVLPKLCIQARAQTTLDRPFKKLVIRAFLNDDLHASVEISPDQLQLVSTEIAGREDAHRISIMAVMCFSPLTVLDESKLRVEAETEEGTLIGGFLRLRKRAEAPTPA